MKLLADAVPAECRHDRVTIRMCPVTARGVDITEEMPGTRRRNAALHDLLCHAYEPLRGERNFSHHIHA